MQVKKKQEKNTFNSSAIIIAKISDFYIMQHVYSIFVNSISYEERGCPPHDAFPAVTEWLMKSVSEYLTMYKNDNVPACVLG